MQVYNSEVVDQSFIVEPKAVSRDGVDCCVFQWGYVVPECVRLAQFSRKHRSPLNASKQRFRSNVSMKPIPSIVSVDFLIENYDAIAFDSYGVLVDGIDPLPGAIEFTDRLTRLGKPWVLATNDASRLTASRLEVMQGQGFGIEEDQVISAGELLRRFFEERGIAGTRCIATGQGDAVEFVRLAGL